MPRPMLSGVSLILTDNPLYPSIPIFAEWVAGIYECNHRRAITRRSSHHQSVTVSKVGCI